MNVLKQRKSSFTWIWITATAALCLLFTFVLIPGAAAQGNTQAAIPGATQAQQNRRFTALMQNVFTFIQNNFIEEVDPQTLFEGAMQGMFNALGDPYSAFLTEADMLGMAHTTQGTFGGVGLNITKATTPRPDGRPMWVEVASPIEGTPGWRAGINPGDFITHIDGVPTETITMDDVLGMLRGTPGEDVTLQIRRGERLDFSVTITRAIIEVPTVRHAMIGDIGYLRIITFTPMTPARAREAISEFQANNAQGLIIDLRNNFGGLLSAAVDVAGIFLDNKLVVETRSRISSENRNFNSRRNAMVSDDIPIVVLINRGSASASEIVAGALKDWGRAVLVGENTFGKGSVQQVYPLEGGTFGFRITTARYFTPSGANIDRLGIPPDRLVSFPEFTEADAEQVNRLINSNKIPEFVNQSPTPTPAQLEIFAQSLEREYGLNPALLRRMIRNEVNRTVVSPVYDLEYDVQLQEALNILRDGQFQSIMEDFRTLRAIQEEAEAAEEIIIAS